MGVALFWELRFFMVFQKLEGKACRSHFLHSTSARMFESTAFFGALEGSGHLWLCDDSRTCAAPLVSSKTLSSGCQSRDARVLCRCLTIESDSHAAPNRAFRSFWWEERNHSSFSHIPGLFVFVLCDLLNQLYYSKSRWCEHLNTCLRARHHHDPHKVKNTKDQSQTCGVVVEMKRQSIIPRKLQHTPGQGILLYPVGKRDVLERCVATTLELYHSVGRWLPRPDEATLAFLSCT